MMSSLRVVHNYGPAWPIPILPRPDHRARQGHIQANNALGISHAQMVDVRPSACTVAMRVVSHTPEGRNGNANGHQKYGQPRVAVDNFDNGTNVLQAFHPAFPQDCGGMDTRGGAGYTLAHPAQLIVPTLDHPARAIPSGVDFQQITGVCDARG